MTSRIFRPVEAVVSALVLFAALPVLAVAMLFIRLDSRGPALLRQTRAGRHRVPFTIYKLRTMAVHAGGPGPMVTPAGDPRVTRVGRLLRRWRIDELPQLWNVVRGDMSWVGARPEIPDFVERFPEAYASILRHRPGLVDPATLRFLREGERLRDESDPERAYLDRILPEKVAISEAYARERTLASDLGVCTLTPIGVAFGIGTWPDFVRVIRRNARIFVGLSRVDLAKAALDTAAVACASAAATLVVAPAASGVWREMLPWNLVIQGTVFLLLGLPAQFWKFFGFKDVNRLVAGTVFGAAGTVPLAWSAFGSGAGIRWIAVYSAFTLLLLAALRFARRAAFEVSVKGGKPILVVGTADAAEPVLRQMLRSPTGGARPVAAFCPEETCGSRAFLHDVPLFRSHHDLARSGVLDRIREITFLGDPVEFPHGLDLVTFARDRGLSVLTLPAGLTARTWSGRSASRSHGAGLLDRAPVATDRRRLAASYRGRTILVVGGAGSIGREIVRTAAALEPARVVAVDLSENGLCYLGEEMAALFPEIAFAGEVGDILDPGVLERVFAGGGFDFVFHAAARKHVTLMETRPAEAIRTNVAGTLRVADAARRSGSGRFVLISTDKAALPRSVMGATKRAAERLLMSLAGTSDTRFTIVRFGNVLGSSGSLLPILRRQMARGGPVTITDPEATRYFITVGEAAELVLQAGSLTEGRETFILEMGEPVRILDLAEKAAALQGSSLRDLGVVYTGLRPGEKLEEILWSPGESPEPTRVPGIEAARWNGAEATISREAVETLCRAAADGDAETAFRELVALLPEYTPSIEALAAAKGVGREQTSRRAA